MLWNVSQVVIWGHLPSAVGHITRGWREAPRNLQLQFGEQITPNCQLNVCLLLSFYAREALLLGQGAVPPSFPEHYILSNGQARVHYVPWSVVDHPQRCSHPSFVLYFFATPPMKLRPQIGGRLLIAGSYWAPLGMLLDEPVRVTCTQCTQHNRQGGGHIPWQ